MDGLRARLTFANVMSVVAVFIALGGAGYAATKLARNSVGTKQIKNEAVTLKKISPATQTSLKGQTGPPGADGSPAASMLTGRFKEGSDYASPSGTTDNLSATESSVSMLSPAAPVVARDLSVSSDHNMSGTETVTLTVNGADTALSCQMIETGPCQDTTHAVTIPPGSTIAIHYQLTASSGGSAGGFERFGWRATTP
jgi:hypothetical protein